MGPRASLGKECAEHERAFPVPSAQSLRLNWRLAGNTAAFGKLDDDRPFWVADFDGDGATELLFYNPATTTGGWDAWAKGD
jgi:hypothetical protein